MIFNKRVSQQMIELTHTPIELFLTYTVFLITDIPRGIVLTALIGAISFVIGAVLLFYEIRALFTEYRSPIPDPKEPEAYGSIRRVYAWIGGIVCTLTGVLFLYVTIHNIYICIIVNPPHISC